MALAPPALPSPAELQGRWVQALEEAGVRPRILEVVDKFPEERSVAIAFPTLEAVDAQLADHLLEKPEESLEAGQRAMRELLPVAGPEAEGLRLRITELPSTAHRTIRAIRETDLGKLLALDGIVRKVTEVRPQIRDAAFLCLACKNEVHELQETWSPVFQEPLECTHCGKPANRTRFRLVPEHSTYIDSQRIEVQENPEKLKGGAHPQGLAVLLTEDLSGRLIPGNRVVVNGVLKGLQRASASRSGLLRSTTFDLLFVGNSMEFQQREYDEIPITEEEERYITSFRGDPTVVDRIVLSLAPTIKGMEEEKTAIALQLFGGVEKRQPDGVRIRGDIHVLLVGDPGCLIGDERITMGDGTLRRLDRMGSNHLQPIRKRVRLDSAIGENALARRFHKYQGQDILEVVTESGKCIKGTYNHPLLRWDPTLGREVWTRLDRLRVGDRLIVVPHLPCAKQDLEPTRWKEPDHHPKSGHVKVPAWVDEDLGAIMGYVLGDGSIAFRRLLLCPSAKETEVIEGISDLFERVFGVRPNVQKRRHGMAYLRVDRTPIAGWLRPLKQHRVPEVIFRSPDRVVASFLRWLFESVGTCFAGGRGRTAISLRSANLELLRDVQTLLLRWGIHARIQESGPPRSPRNRGVRVRGGESACLMIRRGPSMLRFAEAIGFVSGEKRARLAEVAAHARSRSRARHGPTRERIVRIAPAPRATVFDIEIPGHHRFIANGIVSHNTAKSQLLRYIADVAPRGVYTSGKGATAAGLTAAAVKDDFGGGRWVLEAGMLVLADGGIAVVDELDKMSPEDRSAMHEVLEQSTVSIAKAGITATLNARCPVLAAANPKFGRFMPERTVAEQIDLPPTLLSRFDVIYSIQDRPDAERDRSLSHRILLSHQEGEARGAPVLGELPTPSANAPFSPDFLRKYIAWARRNVRPVLTDEALAIIEDFYVRVRKQGEEPNAPVPITARQLEALVRLSEASARARLSEHVTRADAERATGIMQSFLQRVATSEGKLDIDTVTTGVTHSQRERAELLMEIMRQLQDKQGSFTVEEVKSEAERRGITAARADALFFTYRNQGELMEQRPGVWQLVRF